MKTYITKIIMLCCVGLLVIGCGRRLTDPLESLVGGEDSEDTATTSSIVLQLLVSSGSKSAIPSLLGKQAVPSQTSYLFKNASSARLSEDEEALLYVGLLKRDNLVRTILGSLFGSDEEEDTCEPYVLSKLTYDEKISLAICSGSYVFMVVKVKAVDNLADYEIVAMGTKEIDVTATIDNVFQLDIDKNGSLLISNYEELITSGALVETNENIPYHQSIDGSYAVTMDFGTNLSGLSISSLAKSQTEGSSEAGIGNKEDYKSFTIDISQEVARDGTLKSGLIAQSSLTSSFLNGSIEPVKVPFVDSGCFRFDLEYRIPSGASGTCEKIINFNSSLSCFTDVISSIYDAGDDFIVGAFQVVETLSGENCPVMLEDQFVNATGVFHMTKKGDPAVTYEEAQVAITEASTQANVQIATKTYTVSTADLAKSSWCYDKNYSYSQMSETEVKALLLSSKLISSLDITDLTADIGVSNGVVQFTMGSINETLNLESNYGYAYAYKDFITDPVKVSGGCYSSKDSNSHDILSCYINMYDNPNYVAPYCAIYATFTTDPLTKAEIGITPPPSGTIVAANTSTSASGVTGQYIDVGKWKEYKNLTLTGDCSAYPDLVNLYNGTEAYLSVEKNDKGLITFTFKDPTGNVIYKNEAQINDDYYYYKCDSNTNSICTSMSIDKNYYYLSVYIYNYYYYSSSNSCNLNLYLSSDHNFKYTPKALSNQVFKATLQEKNQWGYADYWVDSKCDSGDFKALFGRDTFQKDIILTATLDAVTKKANVIANINSTSSDTSDDKKIEAAADLTLDTWNVLYGKTSYSFGTWNSPQELSVTLSNGTTTKATLSVSGSFTLENTTTGTNNSTYQYMSMYYSRYDNNYYNYCYISIYPSLIEEVK